MSRLSLDMTKWAPQHRKSARVGFLHYTVSQKTRLRATVVQMAYKRPAAVGCLWEMVGVLARGALFTSTPASFSSALMRAEAFSVPKPSATADSRFFLATCRAGMGDTRLLAKFLIRPASLSMSLS